MKIYSVATGCYSDYSETILSNEKVISDEEFKTICKDAMEILQGKSESSYEVCGEKVVKHLVKFYGFKVVKYSSCYLFDYSYDGELPDIHKKGEGYGS